jgi:hypothetical protein
MCNQNQQILISDLGNGLLQPIDGYFVISCHVSPFLFAKLRKTSQTRRKLYSVQVNRITRLRLF